MLSHIVIFWTDPAQPSAPEELIGAAEKYLKNIPGVLQFQVGRMVPSHRAVVDQTYQVGLNISFADKTAEQAYQVHPKHIEFAEKSANRLCKKVVVYDFA